MPLRLTATIHDLVPPSGHVTAPGLSYPFVNLFAMATAPLRIGRLACGIRNFKRLTSSIRN